MLETAVDWRWHPRHDDGAAQRQTEQRCRHNDLHARVDVGFGRESDVHEARLEFASCHLLVKVHVVAPRHFERVVLRHGACGAVGPERVRDRVECPRERLWQLGERRALVVDVANQLRLVRKQLDTRVDLCHTIVNQLL